MGNRKAFLMAMIATLATIWVLNKVKATNPIREMIGWAPLI